LIEAFALGLFMISAGSFGVLLEYPGSPLRQAIEDPLPRRVLMGLAMGATAIALIYSPWGRRSGAHMNPAVTLTFLGLRKIAPWDAAFYVAAQFIGGTLGVVLVRAAFGSTFLDEPVLSVATLPGRYGVAGAIGGEVLIAFVLMAAVLYTANHPAFMRYTGAFCGLLLVLFITFEAPVSGMSLNPARSFASAAGGGVWRDLWLYFIAPPLGMGAAAFVYAVASRDRKVYCAKLNHAGHGPCAFRCQFGELERRAATRAVDRTHHHATIQP
jgi:aquaporin Z